MTGPIDVPLRLSGGFVCRRTSFPSHHCLGEHAHEPGTLSIPFAGSFVERVARRQLEIDPFKTVYRVPGVVHLDHVGSVGFDGILVEVGPPQHADIEAMVGRVDGIRDAGGPTVARRLRAAAAAWRGSDPHRTWSLEAAILDVFAALAPPTPELRTPAWLGLVKEALRDAFPRRPTLAELAGVAGVHSIYLAQTFRKHEGVTVGGYVETLRLEAVHRQLAHTRTPLAEIACDTGFADQPHMTRVFRRAFGVTPARYRRRCRGGPS